MYIFFISIFFFLNAEVSSLFNQLNLGKDTRTYMTLMSKDQKMLDKFNFRSDFFNRFTTHTIDDSNWILFYFTLHVHLIQEIKHIQFHLTKYKLNLDLTVCFEVR